MPLPRFELYTSNRPVDVVMHWYDAGFLELNPPYQRGDVWGVIRRENLIRSLLMGVPIASVIINDRSKVRNSRHWGDPVSKFLSVIDGKQRLTSIIQFCLGHFSVPADWFEGDPGKRVHYDELSLPMKRRFGMRSLAFAEGSLETLEQEEEVFNLVNFGGVPQGQSDTQD